jgi:hypothetical protein
VTLTIKPKTLQVRWIVAVTLNRIDDKFGGAVVHVRDRFLIDFVNRAIQGFDGAPFLFVWEHRLSPRWADSQREHSDGCD